MDVVVSEVKSMVRAEARTMMLLVALRVCAWATPANRLLIAPVVFCTCWSTQAPAFDLSTQSLVVSAYATSKVTSAPFDHKLILAAQDDAADVTGGLQGLCLGNTGQQQQAESAGDQRATHGMTPKYIFHTAC